MTFQKRPVDALIFDLDGTLTDSLSDLTAAVNHVLNLRGRPPVTAETARQYIGDGLGKLLGRALGTEDAAAIQSAAADFRPFYGAHCLDATRLYDGVLDVLDVFGSKRKAVISNKPEEFTRKILDGLGVALHFEIVIGPESVRRQKPDPESYLLVASRFGRIPPDRFCSVGDRPTDIEAGRAAGMMTVGALYGFCDRRALEASGPDALISRIAELEKYIE